MRGYEWILGFLVVYPYMVIVNEALVCSIDCSSKLNFCAIKVTRMNCIVRCQLRRYKFCSIISCSTHYRMPWVCQLLFNHVAAVTCYDVSEAKILSHNSWNIRLPVPASSSYQGHAVRPVWSWESSSSTYGPVGWSWRWQKKYCVRCHQMVRRCGDIRFSQAWHFEGNYLRKLWNWNSKSTHPMPEYK